MSKQAPKKTQTATQLSRVLSGQISKQEKLSRAFRAIRTARAQAHLALRAFDRNQFVQ